MPDPIRRGLSRLVTPGAAFVFSFFFLFVGAGLAAANVVTHDEGLGLAAFGCLLLLLLLGWAFLWPERPQVKSLSVPISAGAEVATDAQRTETVQISPEAKVIFDAIEEMRSEHQRTNPVHSPFTPRYFLPKDRAR